MFCLVQPWEEPAELVTREMVGSFPACSLRRDGKFTGLGTESFIEEDNEEEVDGVLGNGEGTAEEEEEEEEEILAEGRERETIPPWLMLLLP